MPVVVWSGFTLAAHLVFHRLAHHDQSIRIAKGKWLEQNRIHHTEDRGSCADAQRKCEDGSEREAGRLPQLANGIADVASGLFEPRQAPLQAVSLAGLRDAAKGAQSGVPCLCLVHSAPTVFFDGQIYMRMELFVEVGIELLAAEERCAAAEENS